MVGIPYRDIIRLVSDAQGRHPDAFTAPTWLWLLAYRRLRYPICDWQAIGVREYDPDGPARVRDLFIYLAGWAPCTYDLYGSVFSRRAWLRFHD